MWFFVSFVRLFFIFPNFLFTTPLKIQFVCKCSLAFNACDIAVSHIAFTHTNTFSHPYADEYCCVWMRAWVVTVCYLQNSNRYIADSHLNGYSMWVREADRNKEKETERQKDRETTREMETTLFIVQSYLDYHFQLKS